MGTDRSKFKTHVIETWTEYMLGEVLICEMMEGKVEMSQCMFHIHVMSTNLSWCVFSGRNK